MKQNNCHRLDKFFLCFIVTLSVACPSTFAQVSLGMNLVSNGDAEMGSPGTSISDVVSSIPKWTASGSPNVLPYGLNGFISVDGPAGPNHRFQYFAAGKGPSTSTLTQVIDLSSVAALINGGNVKFSASAYLGTADVDGQEQAQLTVAFQNAKGQPFITPTVGPVDFNGAGLAFQQTVGMVPPGTTQATVTLSLGYRCENYAQCFYGAADDISLILDTLGTLPGSVLGTNLLVNGNAESGPGVSYSSLAPYIPGWSYSNGVSVRTYGGPGWITSSDPSPADPGVNLFSQEQSNQTKGSMYQTLDVSAAASLIDSPSAPVSYLLSAWLGGLSEVTGPTITYSFYNQNLIQIAPTSTLAPPKHSGISLVEASQTGTLPAKTRFINVTVTFPSVHSLADDIGFILSPAAGTAPIASAVNAASYSASGLLAPDSIAAAFGTDLANQSGPTGSTLGSLLGGTTVNITDSNLSTVAADLFYVSPGQVNFLVPAGLANGKGTIQVISGDGSISVGPVQIAAVAPGIFTADGTLAVGLASTYDAAGTLVGSQSLVQYDAATSKFEAVPINLGEPGSSTYLILYGTGIRGALLSQISATIGGKTVSPAFAGAQGAFDGEDQINVLIPNSLAGSGDVALALNANGASSNTVHLSIQ